MYMGDANGGGEDNRNVAATAGRYGLAAMCIGVGQGIATVIENLT